MSAPWLKRRPTSPSQWDDEFESTALDPKWTRVGVFSQVSSLDPFDVTNSATHFESMNRHRRSWLMVQPGIVAAATQGYEQDLSTLPSECFIWARVSANTRGSVVDGDGEIFLRLYNTTTPAVAVLVNLDAFTNIRQSLFIDQLSGSTNRGRIQNYRAEGFPIEYVGIQKLTNTYHGWVAPASGNWVWMNSAGPAGVALDRVRLAVNNAVVTSPGRMIVGVDFFRVLAGRTLP
jgi:hypothetical protein